jgi:Dolichyl-phosphate-mannose-protein mannosyltransferase
VEVAGFRAAASDRRVERAGVGVGLQIGAVVAVSFVLRALASGTGAAPRYYPDEYIYAALGRSMGATGTPQIRGGSVHLTQLIEPLLAAPLWALAPLQTAYRLVQFENALFMSLAAIPAYLLARKLDLSPRYSLLCAAFAVATPDLVLSRYILTDPVAYPLVLASLYAGLVALDRPSRRAEIAFVSLASLTAAARLQYAVLFLAFAVAALMLERRRVLHVHRGLAAVLAVAAIAGVAVGPSRAVGYYAGVLHMHVGVAMLRWAAVDLFLLALASGVAFVPGAVAALIRPESRAETAFSRLAGMFGAALLFEAALFASNGSDRFEERYLFTLLPLAPIAFGLYARRSRSERLPVLLVAAGLVIALARLPLSVYTVGVGNNDSPFLFAVTELERLVGVGTGSLVVAVSGSIAVVLGVLPQLRRNAGVLAAFALVLALLASLGAAAYDAAYARAVRAQYVSSNPSWIDALGLHDVAAIETENASPGDLLDQFFWNRSLTRELLLGDARSTDAAPAPRVSIGRDGTLRAASGVVRSPLLWQGYATSATFDGAALLAREGMFALWSPTSTPRMRVLETGRYWNGWLAWNGRVTVWPDRSGRTRGTLSFTLSLPGGLRPVQVGIAGRHVLVASGQRVTLRFTLDGSGPQSLAFATTGGTVARDLRPLSVRSTMPVFVRSRG